MPILPTYQGVSTSIATQRTQEAPLDTSGKDIQKLGQATETLGNTLTHVMQKRQALEDEAMAMQRLMQADSDMRNMQDSFSNNEIGRQARSVYSKTVEDRRKEWFKDLSPGASAKLSQHLEPRLLENRSAAYKIENRVRLHDYRAGVETAATAFVEEASRITDESDGKDTNSFKTLNRAVETGQSVGYYNREEADQVLKNALRAGALSRIVKVSNSSDKSEILNALDIIDRQEGEKGIPQEPGAPEVPGTQKNSFLQHLDPLKREEVKHTLKSRLEHLNNEEIRLKNQAYTDTKRMTDDLKESAGIMAEQKLAFPEKYGALSHEWLDLAGETKLMNATELKQWHERLDKVQQSGAVGTGGFSSNPEMVRRLRTASRTTSTPAQARQVRDEILAGMADGRINQDDGIPMLTHLEAAVKDPSGGAVTPAQDLANVKTQLDSAIRVTGPLATSRVKGIENQVMEMAHRALDENARNGYPKTSQQVYDEGINRWKSMVGKPALEEARLRRTSLGLPPTQDPKNQVATVYAKRTELQAEFQAAPPGPEGDAARETALAKIMDLQKLFKLEQEMVQYGAMKNQALYGGGEEAPAAPTTKSSGGPIKPPKESFK